MYNYIIANNYVLADNHIFHYYDIFPNIIGLDNSFSANHTFKSLKSL